MVTSDFRDDASAAYEVRKELGPEYERAYWNPSSPTPRIPSTSKWTPGLARCGIERRANRRCRPPIAEPERPNGKPDNSHVAVPVFSLLFGVERLVWLTAGAHAESDAVFAMWLGIAWSTSSSARMFRAPAEDGVISRGSRPCRCGWA